MSFLPNKIMVAVLSNLIKLKNKCLAVTAIISNNTIKQFAWGMSLWPSEGVSKTKQDSSPAGNKEIPKLYCSPGESNDKCTTFANW